VRNGVERLKWYSALLCCDCVTYSTYYMAPYLLQVIVRSAWCSSRLCPAGALSYGYKQLTSSYLQLQLRHLYLHVYSHQAQSTLFCEVNGQWSSMSITDPVGSWPNMLVIEKRC